MIGGGGGSHILIKGLLNLLPYNRTTIMTFTPRVLSFYDLQLLIQTEKSKFNYKNVHHVFVFNVFLFNSMS